MSQASTTRDAGTARESTLRSRLLVRLFGLLVLLGIATALLLLKQTADLSIVSRALLGVLLFLGGAALSLAILSLVQHNLLEPLVQVREWARKMREGRYTDPIPAPAYSGFADLAADLNRLGRRLTPPGRKQNPHLFDEHDLEERSLQILYEVVSSINTAHGLDDLLNRFLYTLKRITHAHAAAIWVTQKQGALELSACSGLNESMIHSSRHDVRRCLYERALTEGRIWVEKDLVKCEKIAGERFFEQDNIGLVSVPMRYRGRVTGVINLFLDNKLIEQIEGLKPLLTSIAHHLSIAIERSNSEEVNNQHRINDERTRIAHELHDSLAQSLASLRYQVRVLDETMHQGDESTTWQQLERIENSLDEANTELRGLIANFRAPTYKRGLLDAVEQMVSQFRIETGIKTYLQKEWAAGSLPVDVQTQILRIIQEALWNIRKHSHAKTVRILLRGETDGKYNVLIEDDGVGIGKQVNGAAGEHIGLSIMRERAARLGGILRLESEPGEGTRVALEITQPVRECSPS
ncbi:MAG: histidine kinase [Gammaproteobacteria bacterium]|jgi:two-component system nitrate/nitrite sensor histidine kinase NarX